MIYRGTPARSSEASARSTNAEACGWPTRGRALTAAGIDHDITEYPDPGRSFLNQHNSAVFKIIGKAIGGGYDPAAARRRIVTFFDRHLKTAR